jgi:hypothetical protein
MPDLLESGKVRLSPEEIRDYHSAAVRLHDTSEMALDLKQPISLESWIMLEIARAALEGDIGLLDTVITTIRAEIASRKARS